MNFLKRFKKPSLLHPIQRSRYYRLLKTVEWTAVLVVLIIIAVVGLLIREYYFPIKNLYLEFTEARSALQSAQDSLQNQNFAEAADSLGQAHQELVDAQADLDRIVLPFLLDRLTAKQRAIAQQLLVVGIRASASLQEFTLFANDVMLVLSSDQKFKLDNVTAEQKKELLKKLFESPPLLQGIKAELELSLLSLEQIPADELALPIRQFVAPLIPKLEETVSKANQLIDLARLTPPLVGYPEAKTYLFLLQNNAELRPTGGFIGTYGILKVKDGEIASFETDNIYNLDGPAEAYLNLEPPAPIRQYMGVSRWYMRDANWSPDFSVSARKVEWFYHQEGGSEKQIDGVIAITPTVISSLLEITGPITINGLEFNQDNFIDLLQYQVEKGYYQQGISMAERKNIVGELGQAIIQKFFHLSLDEWLAVAEIIDDNLNEKQILIYDQNGEFWNFVKENNWAGTLKDVADDYLMVVDANLAALKTDKVIKRQVDYSVLENEQGELIAKASITYRNDGDFSWQTTRLRTYTRIYVPLGSQLISSSGALADDRSRQPGQITTETDLGKTVFGGFISIEPDQTGTLTFEYRLPSALAKKVKQGYYNLTVQKQPGTIEPGLKVDLDFRGKIADFSPTGFSAKRLDETRVEYNSNLRLDREFTVNLAK
ncbi:MAG: DUF4012 domain-containing protein [bacterium]